MEKKLGVFFTTTTIVTPYQQQPLSLSSLTLTQTSKRPFSSLSLFLSLLFARFCVSICFADSILSFSLEIVQLLFYPLRLPAFGRSVVRLLSLGKSLFFWVSSFVPTTFCVWGFDWAGLNFGNYSEFCWFELCCGIWFCRDRLMWGFIVYDVFSLSVGRFGDVFLYNLWGFGVECVHCWCFCLVGYV